MPSSLALIREAYTDPTRRGRAAAVWAAGGAVASATGPVVGGAATLAGWRLIFIINLPVGVVALALLARTARSPHRPVPFDVIGQITAVVAMGALTFAAIEAGDAGPPTRPAPPAESSTPAASSAAPWPSPSSAPSSPTARGSCPACARAC
ncbi:MFS transporter [Streptosporangium canum]|nr:MFS transporter [Streptosporangium canum]